MVGDGLQMTPVGAVRLQPKDLQSLLNDNMYQVTRRLFPTAPPRDEGTHVITRNMTTYQLSGSPNRSDSISSARSS
jgi:hypothetical protein